MTIKDELIARVGAANVLDDAEVLAGYAADHSMVHGSRPSFVVRPAGTEEIQAVLKYASEMSLPVTPRSSAVGFYGASLPLQGGIVLDLSRLNRILEIDGRNKKVKLELGVTWGQAQAALAAEGLMVCGPLLPHRDKSVVTTALEREPILIPKNEYSEVFLTAEMVLADGSMFYTGTAAGKGMKGRNFPDGLIPGTRIFLGAQGTLGVVTWANLKAEWLPSKDKVYFIAADSIGELVEPLYRIQRRMMGNECLVLNACDLAAILAEPEMGDFDTLRGQLPPYTAVICLAGLHRLPEEKIAYEEEALFEVASELHFQPQPTVGGVPGLAKRMAAMLRSPWPDDTYWKYRYRDGCAEVFFHTTLDRAAEFADAVAAVAGAYDYPPADIGVYLQPLERARACFCRFAFPYDSEDMDAAATVRDIHRDVSEAVISLGGLFTTPYGPWAEMVYGRTATYTSTLKIVKSAFDPGNILNPGKLCF
jgi:FAD/FMN-containing dehydrogenase